jgi:hypothetical protein
VLVQTEPTDLLMVRYKLYFNQQRPDPEDPWVFKYLHDHGLEPRRQLEETHDGVLYKVWHFGQCYLGRHLADLGALYQRGIEHTVLAQHMQELLGKTNDVGLLEVMRTLDDDVLQTMTGELAAQLHGMARFEPVNENDVRIEIDPAAVHQAFQAWYAARSPQCTAGSRKCP